MPLFKKKEEKADVPERNVVKKNLRVLTESVEKKQEEYEKVCKDINDKEGYRISLENEIARLENTKKLKEEAIQELNTLKAQKEQELHVLHEQVRNEEINSY